MKTSIKSIIGSMNFKYTNEYFDPYLEEFFKRNWLFDSKDDLLRKMNTRLLFGGLGISSQIIELSLRCGFMNLTFADGDHFEGHNKNRQNCSDSGLGKNKACAVRSRLLDINSRGHYQAISNFLTDSDLKQLIPNCDYFINCIDFDSPVYMSSHKLVKVFDKVEIFPFVLGPYCVAIVADKDTQDFSDYFKEDNPTLLKDEIIKHCVTQANKEATGQDREELNGYVERYGKSAHLYTSDPQSALGVYNLSWLVNRIIINLMNGRKVKKFPNINFR